MAAQVDVQPGEVGRSVAVGRLHLNPLTDSSNKSLMEIPSINQSRILASEPNKPVPAPKPRLSPKPFAVDRNPTIKPILAPKPQAKPRPEATRLPGHKPEPPSNPKPQQLIISAKPRPPSTNPNRPAPTSYKTSNKLHPGQTTKPIAQPFKPAPPFDPEITSKPAHPVPADRHKPAASSFSKSSKKPAAAEWSGTTPKEDAKGQNAPSKGGTSITRAKSLGFLLDVGQEEEKKEKAQLEASVPLRTQTRSSRPRPVSAIFPESPTKVEASVPSRWMGRRPLSADLTSKFESIGLSLHRKSPKEETNEEKAEPEKNAPESLVTARNPFLTDPSDSQSEEMAAKGTDEDKRGVSIKSRISLLLDSSSSLVATGQASDSPSVTQPAPEPEPTVGVKKLIKQLTEDTTPTQSPVLKPVPKPRPLALDLTKKFSSERSPDLVSLVEPADRHEISKDSPRRVEETVVTPNEMKMFLDLKDSQEQLKKPSTPQGTDPSQAFGLAVKGSGPAGAFHTVRASLFDNVVERHSVFVMDDGKSVNAAKESLNSPSSKRLDMEDEGTLVTATYREPTSPSSPMRVRHAFDTVQAIEENRAVSESVPSAQWEDKAMTLRSKRSDGNRPVAERMSPTQGQSDPAVTTDPQLRYLRVRDLPKWSNSETDQNADMGKGILKESQREGGERVVEQDDVVAAPKRLKMLPTEEQSKPKATYFALTGQIQEPFFLSDAGTSIGIIDDYSTRPSLGGSQGKVLPIERNPLLDEAFGKSTHSHEQVEELMMKSHLLPRDLEKQRLSVKKENEEAEKIRLMALQQEMFRNRELDKGRQREIGLGSMLDEQTKEEMMDAKNKRSLQKETERHMAKLKEIEREKQRQVEMEKQAHRDFARSKELEMQREAERQRQKVYEKQKELAEKRLALEKQKQIELDRQKWQEMERQKQIQLEAEREKLERQRQLEREKRREAERMQERERQRQREEDRQRELDKERRLLELQKEKQQMEAMERIKEEERQQLQEFKKQKQKERERQQAIELEKQRLREKKEREEAEKMKQMAIEQEMLRIRELEKEKERQKELERERQKEIEREKQRQEQEKQQILELQKLKQKEKERQQAIELEKQRLREKKEREEAEKIKQMAIEQEMLRIRELDKQRERQKEMETERQKEMERQRELEQQKQRERQRQLDMERQEMDKQRLRQREQEKEKKKMDDLEKLKEIEMKQLLELEKGRRAETERQQIMDLERRRLREKMEKEEAEKMRQIAKQQEAERQRLKDKQSTPLRPKVLDLDSVLRNEPLSRASSQRSDPANRWKEPYKPAILDIDSFTSQSQLSPGKDLFPVSGIQGLDADFGARLLPDREASRKVTPQTSGGFSSPVWTAAPQDPWELRTVEMDKSVADPRKQANRVSVDSILFRQEEQPRNPQRNRPEDSLHSASISGTETRTISTPAGLPSNTPMEYSWLPKELQPQESRGEIQSKRRSQGSQELNRIRSRSVSRRSAPAGSSLEGNLARVRSRSAHREQDRHSWVPQKQSSEDEGKDSGTPVHDTDSQYGTWETGLRTDDSLTPATPSSESNLSPSPKKPSPPDTPGEPHASQCEVDTPDVPPPSDTQPLAFPDAPVALLDTSALRSRAQLGKKRARPTRARPARAAHQNAEEGSAEDWLYRDSTESKPERKEEEEEKEECEEAPRGAESTPGVSSQPQRVALFPGMDPSALKAQLKKRNDSDNQVDGVAPSPPQLSRSPKSPFLPRAARVLPPPGGKENGEEDSPQWLKELKSKKRLSQYENES